MLAYINEGAGLAFEQKVVYAAPHPNWGSSGFELVDLDKDGDVDVLLTHGDTFDDGMVKPYHGIRGWRTQAAFRSSSARWRRCPVSIARRLPISTVTATSTSSLRPCSPAGQTSTRRPCRRSPGSNRRSRACSRGARSRWASRVTPRSTSATSMAMATSTSRSGNFSVGPAVKSWVDVWVNGRK